MNLTAKKKTMFRACLQLVGAALMFAGLYHVFWPNKQGVDPITTATIDPTVQRGISETPPFPPTNADKSLILLNSALDAVLVGDFEKARTLLKRMNSQGADRQLITWLMATSGNPAMSVHELETAQEELIQWPNKDDIADNLQAAKLRNPVEAIAQRLFWFRYKKNPKHFQVRLPAPEHMCRMANRRMHVF